MILFSSGKYTKVKMLVQMEGIFLIFCGTSLAFSITAHQFIIPSTVHCCIVVLRKDFPFRHILASAYRLLMAAILTGGFPHGSLVKNLPAKTEDTGSIPGSGRSSGGGSGNRLQCSCLDNPMERGAWRATVPEVTRESERLGD